MQGDLFGDEGSIGEEIGDLERWCAARDLDWIVGVDEAGRGPLAGPVYAGAVALATDALGERWIERLDDSKELEEEDREEAYEAVCEAAPGWAVASASAETIDELNILGAARRAMRRAVVEVREGLEAGVGCVFVDGDAALEIRGPQRTLVGGDGRSYAIAAASILAKVSRDREMEEFDRRWPVYGFGSNKGYPTPDHRRALREHGPCAIHRRSFAGVEPGET